MKKKTKKKKTGIIESRIKRDKNRLLKCLEESLGVVTDACLMANLSRETHYKWYSQDENYKKAVDDISDITLDFAENSLHKQIKAGNTPATTFFLKSKGKKRGYEDRSTIENINHEPIKVIVDSESKKKIIDNL